MSNDPYEIAFASRILGLSATMSQWMVEQVLDQQGGGNSPMRPQHVQSYLTQIRQKLDDIEREFAP